MAVEGGAGERDMAKLLNSMARSRRDRMVAGSVELEHAPHAVDVVDGIILVAAGLEVAD